jgi:hypothetical protein
MLPKYRFFKTLRGCLGSVKEGEPRAQCVRGPAATGRDGLALMAPVSRDALGSRGPDGINHGSAGGKDPSGAHRIDVTAGDGGEAGREAGRAAGRHSDIAELRRDVPLALGRTQFLDGTDRHVAVITDAEVPAIVYARRVQQAPACMHRCEIETQPRPPPLRCAGPAPTSRASALMWICGGSASARAITAGRSSALTVRRPCGVASTRAEGTAQSPLAERSLLLPSRPLTKRRCFASGASMPNFACAWKTGRKVRPISSRTAAATTRRASPAG